MTESVTKIVLEYMIDDSVTNDAIIQGITCGKFLPVSAGLANEVTINKMKKSLSAWGELPSERFPVSFHWKIQKSDGHKNLILQAKMYGYTCNSVKCTKDDKNGFLHAIADQLHQWSLSYLGSEPSILRSNVEHYIMNNLEEYKNILEQNSDVLPNDCMILALSRALNVTIVIIRSDGSDPQVYNQKPPVPIICIGYDCDSFCYRSFTHVAEIKSTKKLQTIIDATPIDAGPKKVVNKRAIETKTYQP